LSDAVNPLLRSGQEPKVPALRVDDLVTHFINNRETATRQGRPASSVYLRDLNGRLGRFAGAFQCDVADVTGPMIEQWLNDEKQIGRNRCNTQRLIRTLFKWAQKRGCLKAGPLPTEN